MYVLAWSLRKCSVVWLFIAQSMKLTGNRCIYALHLSDVIVWIVLKVGPPAWTLVLNSALSLDCGWMRRYGMLNRAIKLIRTWLLFSFITITLITGYKNTVLTTVIAGLSDLGNITKIRSNGTTNTSCQSITQVLTPSLVELIWKKKQRWKHPLQSTRDYYQQYRCIHSRLYLQNKAFHNFSNCCDHIVTIFDIYNWWLSKRTSKQYIRRERQIFLIWGYSDTIVWIGLGTRDRSLG